MEARTILNVDSPKTQTLEAVKNPVSLERESSRSPALVYRDEQGREPLGAGFEQ